MVLTLKKTPKELNDYIGSLKYARKWSPNEDADIRELTKADFQAVQICCRVDDQDNRFERQAAADFAECFGSSCENNRYHNLGLFKGTTLVGFVQGVSEEVNLTTINIFVNRQYRKNGYAKRLLLSLCSVFQDTVYCYSCEKTNIASIATAESCGFIFQGSYLKIF